MNVQFRGKNREIPEYLEELNTDQYVRWLSLAALYQGGAISMEVLRVAWLSHLLGLKTDYTAYNSAIAAEAARLMSCTDGFYDTVIRDGITVHTPRLLTGKQMLPDFMGWHGPGDMLHGMTFGAFTDSLTLLNEVRHTADTETLGTLYEQIARQMYHAATADAPPRPPRLLVIHAVNMLAEVWRQIVSEPIEVNGSPIDFGILFRKGGRSHADDKTGWSGIAMEVAHQGVFGPMAGVAAAPMWDVLLYLYKCKFETLNNKH